MNYIRRIAEQIKAEIPDDVMPSSGDIDRLTDLYALLLLVKGDGITCKDVHDAWALWMTEQDPDHKSIEPFDTLAHEVQLEDVPFRDAIRRVGSRLD